MSDVKAKVIREVRPREAGIIGALTGQRDAALAANVQLAGELAAAKDVIKSLQEQLREAGKEAGKEAPKAE